MTDLREQIETIVHKGSIGMRKASRMRLPSASDTLIIWTPQSAEAASYRRLLGRRGATRSRAMRPGAWRTRRAAPALQFTMARNWQTRSRR
jgi:hypothetical protein